MAKIRAIGRHRHAVSAKRIAYRFSLGLRSLCSVPFAVPPRRFRMVRSSGRPSNLGHILRENRNFEVPADNWESKKVAIIGGRHCGSNRGVEI